MKKGQILPDFQLLKYEDKLLFLWIIFIFWHFGSLDKINIVSVSVTVESSFPDLNQTSHRKNYQQINP